MVFKRDDLSDTSLGTDNWNVADGYTKLKILRQLIMLDRWETIAQFGTEEIGDDQTMDDNTIKSRRVEALQRFHSTLKQLIGNTAFAMKKEDKRKVEELVKDIDNVEEYLGEVFSSKEDNYSHEMIFDIKEKMFKKILTIFQISKDNLNVYLNNSNLIFRASEEVDLDKIMDDIVQGG
jgi:hypothetical protein